MNPLKLISLLLFTIILSSCGTSYHPYISSSVDLSKYKYITISEVSGSANTPALMDLYVNVYNALSETRLTIIGAKQIDSLSDVQKIELLQATYSTGKEDRSTIVGINLVEYISGKPVIAFRGKYEFGINENDNLRGASDRATKELINSFKK